MDNLCYHAGGPLIEGDIEGVLLCLCVCLCHVILIILFLKILGMGEPVFGVLGTRIGLIFIHVCFNFKLASFFFFDLEST